MFIKNFKKLTVIFSLTLSLNAGLVDGISLIVNNEPITLLQIRETSAKLHIDVNKAIQLLIREKLENSLIDKFGIDVSDEDIENEIENISSNAGLSVSDFTSYLEKKGVDIDEYKKDLAKKIKKRKLYKKIVSSRIKRATSDEIEAYYKKHIDLYSIPQMIEVTEYSSKDKQSLSNLIKNPMLNRPEINIKNQILKTKGLNPKLLYIFQQTKEGSFTPILTLKDSFASFYVKRKINVKPIPFDKVKNAIFAKIMDQREKDIIKSYFDKLISEANIKIVRKPI